MCRVLMVHFSGFYAWIKEPLSQRSLEDARQTDLIRQAWLANGKVCGHHKLQDDLLAQGENCFENCSENSSENCSENSSENCAPRLASLSGI